MNAKTNKLIYQGSTALFALSMLFAVGFYFFKHDYVSGYFEMIGFPGWLVYPLGIAKLLGVIGLYTKKYPLVREWAYAGYFYNCVLALSGNALCPEGEFTAGAGIAIILLLVSYFFRRRIHPS